MRRELKSGAFTWDLIKRLYDIDPTIHWQRCEAAGLGISQELFEQLFHEEINNADFAAIMRWIDWAEVRFELEEFSGIALRQVRVDRAHQHALDEARNIAAQFGIIDDREEVVDHWRDTHSWLVPPVIVAGDLLEISVGYELLVGVTRLGNLLGLLDRGEVAEAHPHLVWVGRAALSQ